MHRSRTTAHVAAQLGFGLAFVLGALGTLGHDARAESGDPVAQARARLAKHDARGAIALLEAALTKASGPARAGIVEVLKDAYADAARQAEAVGRTAEAEEYRENLAILGRSPRKPRAAPAAPRTEPAASNAPPRLQSPEPAPQVEVALPRVSESETSAAPAPRPRRDLGLVRANIIPDATKEPAAQDAVAPLPAPSEPLSPVKPLAPPSTDTTPSELLPEKKPLGTAPPSASPGSNLLETADSHFLARRYEQAGSLYASLDKQGGLPRDRRDHWAYCRAVAVVRRINARPTSQSEWSSIDAEIEAIRTLSPTNWFGEYLRNRAAERNQTPNRAAKGVRAHKVIVRGSSPEEATPSGPVPNLTLAPAAPAIEAPARPSAPAWSKQPIFTENFAVVHIGAHRELAEQVAKAAEAARSVQLKRWGDPAGGAPWSPRCEVVLFPDAATFSQQTGQPPDSPGFSTMGMNEGRIVLRRVHLRADHTNLVKAILPHEVTHVVLADLFPQQQIPRWADEGMAVLSEPTSEQQVRAADLDQPLASGRLFRVSDLMTMDYPEARHWPLYYAQSVSLTRFLVEQGTPERFVAFVKEAQRAGFEPALKGVYQISGFEDLQSRWLSFARIRSKPELTASAEAEGEPQRVPSR